MLSLLIVATPASGQSTQNGTSHYQRKERGYELDITLKGDVHLNDDDTDIRSISPGGFIEILEDAGRQDHRLRIEPGAGGRLTYAYRLNGRAVEWSDVDTTWYASLVLRIARMGVDAEARAERILRKKGPDAVLDEVEAMGSSGARKTYMLVLFDKAKLSESELVRAAGVAAGIPSSGDKTEVLIAGSEAFLGTFNAIQPYFDAITSIPSSGDKTRALVHLADGGMLDEKAAYSAALRSGASIASSGDRSQFLVSLATSRDIDTAFLEVVSTIPSSGDKTRVLMHLVERRLLGSAAMYTAAMRTADTIASSGDRARFMVAAAPAYLTESRDAYFNAVAGIPSSGDQSNVLLALLESDALDEVSLGKLLETARHIASSGDKTNVLVAAAPYVTGNDALVDVYLETANTIPASGDQKRALSALLN